MSSMRVTLKKGTKTGGILRTPVLACRRRFSDTRTKPSHRLPLDAAIVTLASCSNSQTGNFLENPVGNCCCRKSWVKWLTGINWATRSIILHVERSTPRGRGSDETKRKQRLIGSRDPASAVFFSSCSTLWTSRCQDCDPGKEWKRGNEIRVIDRPHTPTAQFPEGGRSWACGSEEEP